MSTSELGGWSEEKPVDLEVINISLKMQETIGNRTNNKSGVFIPVSFIYQLVQGKIYFVKVVVDKSDVCVHAKIFQALPCNEGILRVVGIQYPKKFVEPLKPF